MLTVAASTSGDFDDAGEYYTTCCEFLSGTDPSMPSKALIPPNEQNIDRLLKVTGGNSKMHTGEDLIIKAISDPFFSLYQIFSMQKCMPESSGGAYG